MPMIDVYADDGHLPRHAPLARDLATAVMTVEQVPDIPMFRDNTAAFVHDLPADSHLERQRRQHLRPGPGPHQRRRARPRQAAGRRRAAHVDRRRRGRRSLARRPHLGPAHRSARGWLGPARPRQHERRARRGRPGADRRASGEHAAWLTIVQRAKLHGLPRRALRQLGGLEDEAIPAAEVGAGLVGRLEERQDGRVRIGGRAGPRRTAAGTRRARSSKNASAGRTAAVRKPSGSG